MIDKTLAVALAALAADAASRTDGRPPVIAVSGSQGSGKTTLARAVAARIGAAHLSLDDVYLTRGARAVLAADVHPMFATRGPPGTHDLTLLDETLASLAGAAATALPAFDKLADERAPADAWPVFHGRPTAILLDGWCLGATPQEAAGLAGPVNDLEREDDPLGLWRRTVNDRLAGPYAALFDRIDGFLHLAAPSFEVVQGWREEQEAGLLGGPVPEARKAELARFIGHFERITRHMLAGGRRAGLVARLGPDRSLAALEESR